MKKFNFGILGIIGILVLVVFASGCTSSGNSTSSNQSSSNQQNAQQNPSVASVKIIASGPWTGNIRDNSGSRSVQGSGTQTFTLSSNPGIVAATFQKDNSKDTMNSNGTMNQDTSSLTVQILSGGKVVETQTTSADAGVVSVSHSF